MSENDSIVGALQPMEVITAPSIQTIRTTFGALHRSVDTVSADCRAIGETLGTLGDALHVVTQGAGLGEGAGGFGLIGLPIAGALRAAKGVAGQYVKQQTGIPLTTWTDLVASSSTQFEAYLSELDTVAQLAQGHEAATATEIDPQQAHEEQKLLLDVRWRTQAWKQILSRVAQLGQLVDAILQVNLGSDGAQSDGGGPERSSGFSGSLQRRLKEVQSRTVEKTGELQEWLLHPFVEVRDSVKLLPSQIERLAHEVALLEILLDLEIAEIRACLGKISQTEAQIVGMRVAASVILPDLAQRLADARKQSQDCQAYLDRLDGARNAGDVDDRAFTILAEEYRKDAASSRARLDALEAEAVVWRRDGRALLDACADWSAVELRVLAARRLVEQREGAGDHHVLLQREQARLDEARDALASL